MLHAKETGISSGRLGLWLVCVIAFTIQDKDTVLRLLSGADLGGGYRECIPPPEMTCGFLIQLVFCKKKKTIWFIGVEVEQETSALPPKKNPGSAPDFRHGTDLLIRPASELQVRHN